MSRGCVRSAGVTFAIALASTSAQAQDLRATVQVSGAGQSDISMAFTATADGIRINMSQPQPMSIIWRGGPPPRMLVVQGAQCMEMGEQAFQMMQQMQGQIGGDGTQLNIDDLQFQLTGEQETIGPWTARGVLVTGMDDGQEATVWISSDLDVGLLELLTRMGDAFESMPIGRNVSQLAQFREIRETAILPEGGVVQLTTNSAAGSTELTLQEIALGSFSLDEPSNCQQMPTGLRLPE